jgi:hypothetical protein
MKSQNNDVTGKELVSEIHIEESQSTSVCEFRDQGRY